MESGNHGLPPESAPKRENELRRQPRNVPRVSEETLIGLEYPEWVKLVGGFMGKLGRKRLRRLQPVGDLRILRRRQRYWRGLLAIHAESGSPTLRGQPDIRPFLRRAAVRESWLTPPELLQVARVFDALDDIRTAFRPHASRLGPTWRLLESLPRLQKFRHEVHRYITREGDLQENASPEYRRLTRELRALQKRIETKLHGFVADPDTAAVVQDTVTTRRERRWVLLVRADQQTRIPGLVLGSSGSGASVYLEPFDIVELNNRYVLLEDERKAEIVRILKRLTQPLREIADPASVVRKLSLLDFILGVARWAVEFEAHLPRMVTTGELRLKNARHPLLAASYRKKGKRLIPLDLEMGENVHVMILTGPNAGGKTVALKTVGLLAVAAQSGLPVTADEGTTLPVFSSIQADIGDRQDLAQDLSTFAAHIRRLAPMLKTPDALPGLFLIDELGSGTDPVEGAALSRAVLEVLQRKPGKVLAVTHLPELKWLAIRESSILSASMEFDSNSLAPTFRLIPHTAGASHALDIARRMGLPEPVLERARRLIRPDHAELSEALQKIEDEGRLLQRKIAELDALREQLERERETHEQAWRRKLRHLETVLKEFAREKQSWMGEVRRSWETFLKDVRETEEKRRIRARFRTWQRTADATIRPALQEVERLVRREPRPSELQPGVWVRIRTTGTTGRVAQVDREHERVTVIVRGKRVQIPIGWLEKVPEPESPTWAPEPPDPGPITAPTTVNLLGYTVEDAEEELERVLDQAVRAGRTTLRVIHGYRPGKLKKAVLRYLTRHPAVLRVDPAPPREGGPGASVVRLREDDA